MGDWLLRRQVYSAWRRYSSRYRPVVVTGLKGTDRGDVGAVAHLHETAHRQALSLLAPDRRVVFAERLERDALLLLAGLLDRPSGDVAIDVLATLWCRDLESSANQVLPRLNANREQLGLANPLYRAGWEFAFAVADANGKRPLILRPDLRPVRAIAVSRGLQRVAEMTDVTPVALGQWVESDVAVDGAEVLRRLRDVGAYR